MDDIWNHIDEITEFVKEKESFNEIFFGIVNRLAFIEHSFGEEYSTLEKVKMLSYMSKVISEKYGTDFGSRKDVFGLDNC